MDPWPPTVRPMPAAQPWLLANGAMNLRLRIGVVQTALVGGVAVNINLIPALPNNFANIQIIGLISDSNFAAMTVYLHDTSGGAVPLTGLITGGATLPMTANIINKDLAGCILYANNANAGVLLDIGGGAGVEIVTIMFYYWYEQ